MRVKTDQSNAQLIGGFELLAELADGRSRPRGRWSRRFGEYCVRARLDYRATPEPNTEGKTNDTGHRPQ
jgi:hypothetical protein